MKTLTIYFLFVLFPCHIYAHDVVNSKKARLNKLTISILRIEKKQSIIDYIFQRPSFNIELELDNNNENAIWFCFHQKNRSYPLLLDSGRISPRELSYNKTYDESVSLSPFFLDINTQHGILKINFDSYPVPPGKHYAPIYAGFRLIPPKSKRKIEFDISFPVESFITLSPITELKQQRNTLKLAEVEKMILTIGYFDSTLKDNQKCCEKEAPDELFVNCYWANDNVNKKQTANYEFSDEIVKLLKKRFSGTIYKK